MEDKELEIEAYQIGSRIIIEIQELQEFREEHVTLQSISLTPIRVTRLIHNLAAGLDNIVNKKV